MPRPEGARSRVRSRWISGRRAPASGCWSACRLRCRAAWRAWGESAAHTRVPAACARRRLGFGSATKRDGTNEHGVWTHGLLALAQPTSSESQWLGPGRYTSPDGARGEWVKRSYNKYARLPESARPADSRRRNTVRRPGSASATRRRALEMRRARAADAAQVTGTLGTPPRDVRDRRGAARTPRGRD